MVWMAPLVRGPLDDIGLIYGWVPRVCEPSQILYTFLVYVNNLISEDHVHN